MHIFSIQEDIHVRNAIRQRKNTHQLKNNSKFFLIMFKNNFKVVGLNDLNFYLERLFVN